MESVVHHDRSNGRVTAESFERGELRLIPEAAHWPFAERPDVFHEVVEAFLSRLRRVPDGQGISGSTSAPSMLSDSCQPR